MRKKLITGVLAMTLVATSLLSGCGSSASGKNGEVVVYNSYR